MSGHRVGWLIGGGLAMAAVIAGLAVGAVTTRDDGGGAPATTGNAGMTGTSPAEPASGTVLGSVPPAFTLPDLSLPLLTASTTTTLVPPPTDEPAGLGTDAELNLLAEDCYDGEMQACDDLYRRSPAGSGYEAYGDTCAGRQPENTRRFCANVFDE